MNYPSRKPINSVTIDNHVATIRECIHSLHEGIIEGNEKWRILSDVVQMSQTFVAHKGGKWRGCDLKTVTLNDDDGVIDSGLGALALAGMNHLKHGGVFKICEEGRDSLLDLLDCYEEILRTLPHSEVEKCRNITNRRVWEIRRGKHQSHDVVVVSA